MTHSDLVRVEVQGADILVAMRGTCFRMKYRKQQAPWLIAQEYGPDDPGANDHTFRISNTCMGGSQRQGARAWVARLVTQLPLSTNGSANPTSGDTR
jgi:hypothetical protein